MHLQGGGGRQRPANGYQGGEGGDGAGGKKEEGWTTAGNEKMGVRPKRRGGNEKLQPWREKKGERQRP